MRGYYYYYFILQYCPLVPLLAGVPNYQKLDRPLKIFVCYLSISLLLTVLMTVLALRRENNLWVMNLSEPVYVWLALWMFQCWEPEPKLRALLQGCIALFVSVWFFEIFLQHKLFQFTTYARPLDDIIIIFVSFLTIYRANKMLDEPIVNKPSFWISGGMLLYCGGVIIINLISESLLKQSEELLRLVFLPQVTLQLCAHLFYLVAFRRGIRRHALLYKGAFV